MTAPSRLVFINLPVADLEASMAFYRRLGFTFDERFTDEKAACMVIAEDASYAMLLDREFFATFTAKPVADPHATTQALIAVSAEDRAAVDALADAALAAGGAPAREPMDHGFMYQRSFYDPDGHHWEVMWMRPEAAQQGAPDAAPAA
ncbi:MAG: VOC family protein [Solirubrobacteraceae bacterium]|nr:VOC family protein [Solirubrobacteraceae bacterium]